MCKCGASHGSASTLLLVRVLRVGSSASADQAPLNQVNYEQHLVSKKAAPTRKLEVDLVLEHPELSAGGAFGYPHRLGAHVSNFARDNRDLLDARWHHSSVCRLFSVHLVRCMWLLVDANGAVVVAVVAALVMVVAWSECELS